MSEIIDLGSPDRELSAGDIKRKTNKLNRINTRLENTSAGTRRRHNLEFKKEKTIDQITTGKSGIRPVKKPFKVSHHYDLQQEEKFNAGVSREKSPLNIVGIKRAVDATKNIVDQAITTHWQNEEKAYGGNTSELNSAYAVYDRGRFKPDGKGGGSYPDKTPKLRTRYNTPAYDNETQSEGVGTYKNWKNKK